MQEGAAQPRREGEAVNAPHVEEIKDYKNEDIRVLLQDNELVREGDVLEADDYEAIRSRAKVLLEQSAEPLSAEAALMAACVDRLTLKEKIGMEALRSMPAEILKAVFYAETGVMFTEEEIELFKNSQLPADQWIRERRELRQTLH